MLQKLFWFYVSINYIISLWIQAKESRTPHPPPLKRSLSAERKNSLVGHDFQHINRAQMSRSSKAAWWKCFLCCIKSFRTVKNRFFDWSDKETKSNRLRDYHVEKRGGRGIGGLKSSLCWERIWSSPVWNLTCGDMKGLGGLEVLPTSCNNKKKTMYHTSASYTHFTLN